MHVSTQPENFLSSEEDINQEKKTDMRGIFEYLSVVVRTDLLSLRFDFPIHQQKRLFTDT